jgi:acyl transferase domain-containing protein/NAD(P)-dependent dehydrogenase (short-subunit alcohol dehydrogenase family)
MKNLSLKYHCPVAIVGISSIFPGSENVTGFWQNLLEGKDQIKEVPSSHWLIEDYYDENPQTRDKTYGKRGAFLPDVDFDPMAFGILPNALEATDSGQLLGLLVAKQVLDDAYRGQFNKVDKSKISVILGTTGSTELILEMAGRMERPKWLKALREEGVDEERVQSICDRIASQYVEWKESSFPGLLANVIAGRIAHRLELGGTNFVTDAACASSLSALSISLNELYMGHSDLVITGGVDALNTISMFMCFSKTPALSPTGDCRPFSESADGTMLGEGIGMIAIKRLEDAQEDGDQIYAVIKALGSSSDGKGKSVYAPVAKGQARCLERTYNIAGYDPETVELVEAHGTATKAGDIAEFEGLSHVFQNNDNHKNWCALGSVKSNIGHTKAASGIAGIIKAVLALNHRTLPPSIKIDRPNPKLDIKNSAFYLNTKARPWIRGISHPRRAGISSFGFGGTNFHVTIEEYQPEKNLRHKSFQALRKYTFKTELFLFSADRPSDLQTSRNINNINDETFRFLARQSRQEFKASQEYRLAIIAANLPDFKKKLRFALNEIDRDSRESFDLPNNYYYVAGKKTGKLGFVFSGQGSQYLNMGADLAMNFDCARSVWDRYADTDIWQENKKLHQVVFPCPAFEVETINVQEALLQQTEWAQPAIVSMSLSHLNLMNTLGLKADGYAGHSLGELTALHAAGVFDQESLIRIARHRGLLMKEASKIPGSMVAVMVGVEEVQQLLAAANNNVVIANYNAPKQTILAGEVDDIASISATIEKAGIKVKLLPVSTAFHSQLVSSSVSPFKNYLSDIEFKSSSSPIFSNFNGRVYPNEPVKIREQLSEQIQYPVHFTEQVEQMYDAGIRTFVELGPGYILTKLIDACLEGREHTAIALDSKEQDGVSKLWHGLGQLAVRGFELDFTKLLENYEESIDPATLPTAKMNVKIGGSNYGKLYPPAEGASALPKPNLQDKKIEEAKRLLKQEYREQPPQKSITNFAQNSLGTVSAMNGETNNNNGQHDWIQVMKEAQEATLKAQLEFQKTMAESHQAFLKVAEISMLQTYQVNQTNIAVPQVLPIQQSSPTAMQPEPITPDSKLVFDSSANAEDNREQTSVIENNNGNGRTSIDLKELMLKVVAQKTGYPSEMLTLDMHLENDLGIDSIKRVEILAAVTEQLPHLPELDNNQMVKLSTLLEITNFIDRHNSVQSSSPPTVIENNNGNGRTSIDLKELILKVVAQKTGYPSEMLTLDMHLENDLGIDSIKRVEILAAVTEQLPHLPELDNNQMAKLSTLLEITNFIDRVSEKTSFLANHQPQSGAIQTEISKSQIERFILKWVESSPLGFQTYQLQEGDTVVISQDEHGIAGVLADKFKLLNFTTHITNNFDSDVLSDANLVIFLNGLNSIKNDQDAFKINQDSFGYARKIAPQFTKIGGVFVTVQDTGGQFLANPDCLSKNLGNGNNRALLGGLAGLVKTAAIEWSKASVKAIDLEQGGRKPLEIAQAIFDEVLTGGLELEVGLLADGTRGTLISVPSELEVDSTINLPSGSVIVASGGARGVTAASLIRLAKKSKPKIALLGRTEIFDEPAYIASISQESELMNRLLEDAKQSAQPMTPIDLTKAVKRIFVNREIKENIKQMEHVGATVNYYVGDVRDQSSVEYILDCVRQEWGSIHAIVHGAGVILDKLIVEKQDRQFNLVFGTKVDGLISLLNATLTDPLKMICLFSSVAGRSGNNGQSDYAMANEVLNKMAVSEYVRRQGQCVVKAINWGPWDSGMVNPALKKKFDELGVPLIPLNEGSDIFTSEVTGKASAQVEIVVGGRLDRASLLPSQPKQLLIDLSSKNYWFLSGHSIGEKKVVPFVLVGEWIKKVCQSNWPYLYLNSIDNLQCLKGISLENIDLELILSLQEISSSAGETKVQIDIASSAGKHYSAWVTLTIKPNSTTEKVPQLGNLEVWPLNDSYYDGKILFHEPPFKVISRLTGINSLGIEGELESKVSGSFANTFIFDGGIQIAVLWVWKNLGGGSLPVAMRSVKMYVSDFDPATLCTVKVQKISKQKAIADIFFHDSDGNLSAEINGLELVVYFEQAFAQNHKAHLTGIN